MNGLSAVATASVASAEASQPARFASMPSTHRAANSSLVVLSRWIDWSRLRAISGMRTLSSNCPWSPPTVIAVSLPITWALTWSTTSGSTGFTFPGMIDEPFWSSGSRISPIPARGDRGDPAARAPEGLVDHAGEGEPGAAGGRAPGQRPGDRQRHRDHGRRAPGAVRAQRAHPADGAQPAPVDTPAEHDERAVRGPVRRGHRGEPRRLRGLGRGDARRRHRAQPVHRLRPRDGDRQGRGRQRAHAAGGGTRARRRRVDARRGARPPQDRRGVVRIELLQRIEAYYDAVPRTAARVEE